MSEHTAVMSVSNELWQRLLMLPDDVRVVEAYTNPMNGTVELLLEGNLPDTRRVTAVHERGPEGVVRFVRWEDR